MGAVKAVSFPILITKVVIPAWREEILTRQRLTSLFDDLLDFKLIIIAAPAGYGKTSLLLDIAHHNGLTFCWYTLDPLDKDIVRFLAHFIACINQRFPTFGEQSQSVLQSMNLGSLNVEEIGTVIINELYQTIREHFIIVLDDYQLVDENQAINQFINRFIQTVDQNCHLAITSRSLLPFSDLPLMVAHSQVGGLGLPELAFHPDEIQALMLRNYQQVIPPTVAIELAQKTDGWITGLLLSAQTMWQGMVDRLRLARVSGVELYDYLIQQVLNQQPPTLREFLLRTSFFDEFNTDLCAALLGSPPPGYTWQGMLDEILSHNLFVLPVDQAGSWLRYHHLFRDFLQSQFAREQPAEVKVTLQRLVEVFAEREEWERAYSICQHLGDFDLTANLIEIAGESLVVDGRTSLLKSWLESLPNDLIQERPILLARYGIALALQRETSRGLQMLDQSISMLRETNKKARLTGTLVWRALTHYIRAEYPQALSDAREVFSLTQDVQSDAQDEDPSRFRAEAYRISGQCYQMMGQLTCAMTDLNIALEIFKRLEILSGVSRALSMLGVVYLEMCDFHNALVCYNQALGYYQKQKNVYSSASVMNDIAYLHYLRGEYPQAFTIFNEALAKARQSGNARVEGLILIGLADIFADLAGYAEALDAYAQGRIIIEKIKDEHLLTYIDLAEAAIARQRGDILLARAHLNSVGHRLLDSKAEHAHGFYLLETGLLALAENDYIQAVAILREARELFASDRQCINEIRANYLLAAAEYENDQYKQASQRIDQTCKLAIELDGRHILVQAARQVKGTLIKMASAEGVGLPAMRLLEQVTAFESNLTAMRKTIRTQETVLAVIPPRLYIQAFGQIQVRLADKPVTSADWQTQVTRDLLYLVLSDRRDWGKEEIGEILWPESSPSQLKQRFKNTIYRLRRALNQDVILYSDGYYSFNRGIDYEYDVEQFETFLAKARKAIGIEAQIEAYLTAFRIYIGDYLPGVDGEWVMPERQRLQQAFLNSGLLLANLYMKIEKFSDSLEVCRRLITIDPCLEEVYPMAMSLYAREGNRAAITQLYQDLQSVLLDYVGSPPSPQTESLYQSLVV